MKHKYGPDDFLPAQVLQMLATLGKCGFSPEMAASVADAGSGRALQIVQLLSTNMDPVAAAVQEWQDFYRVGFDMKADLAGIPVPAKRPGFDRLIVVAKGITPQRLFERCQQVFPSWKYAQESLDDITISDRTSADGSYALWVRDRVEADEELSNCSANELRARQVHGITIEERLLYELKYFVETGKHLDLSSTTLCSGSHHSWGGVPYVRWHYGKLNVDWREANDSAADLRCRDTASTPVAGSLSPQSRQETCFGSSRNI